MAIAKTDIAGLILIGGDSTRMGRPKALVEMRGIPLWQRAVDTLGPFVNDILFLGEVPGFEPPVGTRLVKDARPGQGPLGGLLAGLSGSGYEHHLLLGVDYPLIRGAFIERLLDSADSQLAVCGKTSEALEPLVAYYHRDCMATIRTMLEEGETSAFRLFYRVASCIIPASEMTKIDPAKWTHFNVNTPADLIEAESRLLSGYPL